MMKDQMPEAVARVEYARDVIVPRVRELALRWFQSPDLKPERKADGSVVTIADKKAEELIRATIAREFPGDAVLGEEFGESAGNAGGSGFRWILDPIDGTASFVRGIPHFVSLIGIEQNGEVVAGVVDAPALGERLAASRGSGTQWTLRNGEARSARVSDTAQLSQAFIEIGPMRGFHNHGLGDVHQRLCLATKRNRGWSDGYTYMLLATGRIDAAIYFGFQPWDLAAGLIVIEEAGGRVTDWQCRRGIDTKQFLGSNGRLHESLLQSIAPSSVRNSET